MGDDTVLQKARQKSHTNHSVDYYYGLGAGYFMSAVIAFISSTASNPLLVTCGSLVTCSVLTFVLAWFIKHFEIVRR